MRNPIISIITTTCNSASMVERVILSVVNQNYPEIEHIFIDNFSVDKTVSIIGDYQKKYNHIRFITEKDNGVYDAMNKGLKLCTGDWICFLGADDEFYNGHILEELFELGLFQQEQVIYGNVLVKGDTSWAKDGTIYNGPFDLEKLFRKNICHQSIFYPRSVIKKVGYFSDKYQVTADWDYNIRCFAQYKFTYTDKIIAIFKGGGKSSGNGDPSFYEDLPENVIKYFQLDPQDTNLHVISSPFYYPIARYRQEKYFHINQDQKTEHLNAIENLMAKNEDSKMAVKTKYEQKINLIQTELNTIKKLLSHKEDELNQIIETGKQQIERLSNIIAINDEEIARLKAMVSDKEQEIHTILQSYTWKTGRIFLFPVQFLLGKLWKYKLKTSV